MTQDQLYGTFTLVRPDLTHDPARRANEIGIIVSNDTADDTVEVSFQDNQYDFFASDSLLVLLSGEDIQTNLSQIDDDTNRAANSALMKIALIVKYGSGAEGYKALELARDNKSIQTLCLQTLEDKLKLDQNRGFEY